MRLDFPSFLSSTRQSVSFTWGSSGNNRSRTKVRKSCDENEGGKFLRQTRVVPAGNASWVGSRALEDGGILAEAQTGAMKRTVLGDVERNLFFPIVPSLQIDCFTGSELRYVLGTACLRSDWPERTVGLADYSSLHFQIQNSILNISQLTVRFSGQECWSDDLVRYLTRPSHPRISVSRKLLHSQFVTFRTSKL